MNQKNNSRLRLFLENFFIYGLSSILLRLVPIIMVPIMTRLLPDTSDYGVVDLYTTIVSLGVVLGGIGMYDSAFRFFFEEDDIAYRKLVCVTAGIISCAATFLLLVIMLLCKSPLSLFVFSDKQFSFLIVLAGVNIMLQNLSLILAWPVRFENKRKIYVLSNFFTSILMYLITVWLLLNNWSFMAVPIAGIGSYFCLSLFYWLYNKKWFSLFHINTSLIKELLFMGVPVMISLLVYWVFHSTDRIMISNMLGTHANGIYAVGSKIAAISQFIYTAFAGGWQYFAFSTMKENDQVEMTSNIMQWLAAISFFVFGFVCLFYKFVFSLLFEGDYILGYTVFPYLFLAPLIQMLFQVSGNQLLVIKKSFLGTIGLIFGAAGNILLNFILIPRFGIKGAGLATLFAYLISLVSITYIVIRNNMLTISPRFIACCTASVFLSLHIFLWDNHWTPVFSALLIMMTLILYWKDLYIVLKKIYAFARKKRAA